MTTGVKRESLFRRLIWLGSATLLTVVYGNHIETQQSHKSLRHARRRNTRAVTGLDEHIHHAGKMQLQELADAIAENNSINETTNISEVTSPTAIATASSAMRKDVNTNSKMRLGPESNSAPIPERSILRQSFRYPTNANGDIFNDEEFLPKQVNTASSSSDGTIKNVPSTGKPSFQDFMLENSRHESAEIFDRSTITDDTQDNVFADVKNSESNSVVLTYLKAVGICGGPGPGVGCADEQPNAEDPKGNPNDIVNCYDVSAFGVEIPFSLDSIRFWIGDSTAVPPDLQLNVWVGTPGGGPISSRLLYSQPLLGHTLGKNSFDIDFGALVRQSNICVGVTSLSVDAGLRIQTDPGGAGEASYIRSPACLVDEFTSLFNAGLKNDFCIEVLVSFGDV
mmetsp:Transcript_18283/g.42080  ORF Transcript_18283/g.42080 Transcript_18283/m.42080 type:complete len:396 (-) Transcript_18283:1629-2816(-)|eukprot:CAMPEP_0197181690 /NCGR_PEP_ID=MMETSP1423-20130617/5902_1 /TAXON_ID=476441 /ORGANISM="Pseudo-nitzschia heimii, Strain UNC1101" /LENGTH=395 /DNA_ID=CAMNT_0042631987 /DNA_START=155 /DNA_END=1342 /DNA_ORIENTATION=+